MVKMKYKRIVGKKVVLGPISKDYLETYTRWMNDMEVTKYITMMHVVPALENEEKWYENRISKKDAVTMAIFDRKTEKLIGNVSLNSIDHVNRNAELGITIGEKDYWGKGYGTEATILVVDFAFNALNLNSISLTVYAYNKRAIKSYEKVGFKKAGVLRQARIIGGRKYDVVVMDILSKDFKQNSVIREIMKDSS